MIDEEIDEITRASFPAEDTSYEEKYWNDLESMLGDKGRKKGFIFWWGAGISILLISTIGMYSLTNDMFENSNEQLVQNSTLEINDKNGEATTEEKTLDNKTLNNEENKELSSSIETLEPSEQNLQPKNNSTTQRNQEPEATASMLSTSTNTPAKNKNKPGIRKGDKAKKPENEKVLALSNATASIVTPTTLAINSDPQSTNGSDAKTNPIFIEDEKIDNENDSKNKSLEAKIIGDGVLEVANEVKPDLEPESEINEELTEENSEVENEEPKPAETEFGAKVNSGNKFKFFVQPIISFSGSQKGEVSLVESATSSSHISPSAFKEWNGGLELGLQYGSFYVLSGVRFQEFNQSYSIRTVSTEVKDEYQYNQRNEVGSVDRTLIRNIIIKVPDGNDFIFKVAGQEYSSDTNWTVVTDTVLNKKEIVTESEFSVQYKLQYLNVPFMVGYEHLLGEKWALDASGGVNIGFLIGQSGTVYNSNTEEVVSIEQSSAISNTTFGFSLRMSVGYYITPDLSFRISPNYRFINQGPNKISNKQQNFLGIGAGIRYKF